MVAYLSIILISLIQLLHCAPSSVKTKKTLPVFAVVTQRNFSTISLDRPLETDPLQLIASFTTELRKNFSIGLGLFYSKYASDAFPNINIYALSLGRHSLKKRNLKKYTVHNFGPLIGITSNPYKSRLVLIAEMRPGFILFFNNANYAQIRDNFYSPAIGIGGVLGIEYRLGRHLGLITSLNGLYASEYNLTNYVNTDEDMNRNISALDVGIEFKYHITTQR